MNNIEMIWSVKRICPGYVHKYYSTLNRWLTMDTGTCLSKLFHHFDQKIQQGQLREEKFYLRAHNCRGLNPQMVNSIVDIMMKESVGGMWLRTWPPRSILLSKDKYKPHRHNEPLPPAIHYLPTITTINPYQEIYALIWWRLSTQPVHYKNFCIISHMSF